MGERMIAMSTTPNLASIKPSLDKLQAIERELTASLIEREEVIRASLVALRPSGARCARAALWAIRYRARWRRSDAQLRPSPLSIKRRSDISTNCTSLPASCILRRSRFRPRPLGLERRLEV